MRCSNIATCTSLDFDYQSNECWIHTRDVENTLGSASCIDHYERVPCLTSTTMTTEESTDVTEGTSNFHYFRPLGPV